ncbi:MAG: beta-N-acetylhexosaminidase [Bacteroidales bacterium]|nr:beta-N-acetylhexosaminidase [Bacteroidales bacterium]
MNFINTKPVKTFLGGCIILFLLVGIWSCQKQNKGTIQTSQLLPAPQNVEPKPGNSIAPEELKSIYLYSEAEDDDRFAANRLQNQLDKLFDHHLDVQMADSYKDISRPAIILGVPSEDPEFSEFASPLPVPKKDTDESYVLDIQEDLITVSGGGHPGVFYGVQTLVQLMEEAKWANKDIPGLRVEDWPELNMRTVHLDVKHHLDRYECLKNSIVKLAKYKVNGIVFEFENKFQYQSHPAIAAPNSFTPEQVKKLTQFAHQYHIDIIPLVQGLGHAGYVLKHDEYKHLREDPESNWAFCPLKDGTYEVLFDLYRETIEATPGVDYLHVGGDEVRVMGRCPRCKKEKQEDGELGLYLTWLNKVNDFLEKHDRTMIFWDDVPLKEAEIYRFTHSETSDKKFDSLWTKGTARLDNIIDKFPQDGVFNRWNYGLAREKGNIRILDWYNKHNFNTLSATAIQNTRPLIPSYERKPANIKSFVSLSAEKNVLGALCTAWDDAGVHFETFWMGFLASSEYAWSSKNPAELEQYWEKYIRRFFGPNTTGLISAFQNLSKRVNFWDTALMKEGRKHMIHRNGHQLRTLPDFQDTPEEGTWSEHFQSLIKSAKEEKQQCTEAIETMERNMDRVSRNGYNLKVYASMGRFMKDHCDLVLSLGKIAEYCDKAKNAHENGEKKKVIDNLTNMAATADLAWKSYKSSYQELKDVWEISRYPKGGKGFVPNRYHHFASRREDLSYLIMAEEQMNFDGYAKKLRKMAEAYEKHENLSINNPDSR